MRDAEKIAKNKGRTTPALEDIKAARTQASKKRAKAKVPTATVRISRSTAIALLSAIKGKKIAAEAKRAAIVELASAIGAKA